MNRLKKIITKQFPTMSKKDSYTTNIDGIPLWEKYEAMNFNSSAEMLVWVQDDRLSFTLSDKVYDAMIDCLKNKIEQIIVTKLVVKDGSEIDVLIRKPNFQKIFSSYTEKLLEAERYEKLAEIKQQIQKYGLEM